jgi:hypothetical protein
VLHDAFAVQNYCLCVSNLSLPLQSSAPVYPKLLALMSSKYYSRGLGSGCYGVSAERRYYKLVRYDKVFLVAKTRRGLVGSRRPPGQELSMPSDSAQILMWAAFSIKFQHQSARRPPMVPKKKKKKKIEFRCPMHVSRMYAVLRQRSSLAMLPSFWPIYSVLACGRSQWVPPSCSARQAYVCDTPQPAFSLQNIGLLH